MWKPGYFHFLTAPLGESKSGKNLSKVSALNTTELGGGRTITTTGEKLLKSTRQCYCLFLKNL